MSIDKALDSIEAVRWLNDKRMRRDDKVYFYDVLNIVIMIHYKLLRTFFKKAVRRKCMVNTENRKTSRKNSRSPDPIGLQQTFMKSNQVLGPSPSYYAMKYSRGAFF